MGDLRPGASAASRSSDPKSEVSMRVAIKTLGCKVNQYDSAVIRQRLGRRSCAFVPFEETADVYVINTCTVTDKADWEARQLVRRARRAAPAARIVVTGCYAQVSPEEVSRLPGVDFVVGLNRMDELVDCVLGQAPVEPSRVRVGAARQQRGVSALGAEKFEGHTRAFLKVQEGCNFACSYCIIPAARGRSRSVAPGAVLEQVRALAAQGFVEVVLTGIHLGGYGHDLRPRTTLSALVREIADSGLIRRLRLSSLDPRELTRELLDAVAASEVVCPHLHVCVQSGDDAVLKAMRRNYDTAYFEHKLAEARALMPGAALGTDFIVGFPGETDESFRRSLEFLERLPLTYLHVFPYSVRAGTPAAGMAAQVPNEAKKERSRVARALGAEKKQAFYRAHVGRRVAVLVERASEEQSGCVRGYSENYMPVTLPGAADLINRVVPVEIRRWAGGRLWGEPMEGPCS